MKLSKAIDEFIKEEVIRGSTEATINHYKRQLKPFLKFYTDKDVNCITYEVYQNYILYLKNKNKESSGFENKKLKLSSRTIKTYASALKTFLIYAYEHKFIKENVGLDIKMPRYQKKVIVVLTDIQIQELISLCDKNTFVGSRDFLIITLMLDTRFKTF